MDLFSDDTLVDTYDDYNDPVERVCGMCGKLKPISEFYKNGRGPSGRPRYRRDCKTCYGIANAGRTKAYRDRKWEELYGADAFITKEQNEEL